LVAVVLAMLSAGYTAGYLLAPPGPAAVSLTVPQAPIDVPQPVAPLELAEEDA
jgi:hypothetical protein